MKDKATRQTQLLHGLTRMTKREEKSIIGYGRSGNAELDRRRMLDGQMASHVKDKP